MPLFRKKVYETVAGTRGEPTDSAFHGFVVAGARGISAGVKGTGEAGGEDKERSGTGAALTPKRRALEGNGPSTKGGS